MKKILSVLILVALLSTGCITTRPTGPINWKCKEYAERKAASMASMCASGDIGNQSGAAFGNGAGYGLIYTIEYNQAYKECVKKSGY